MVFQGRQHQRFWVSNLPTLLQSGTINNLAVGQFGIFDAKTNQAIANPTYQNNPVIYIAQGTPDHSNFVEGAMVPNVVRRTKNINGKLVKKLFGKKANRGQVELVTLGYDGIDTTKTLTAKPGETVYYWVRLTGDPIFNLNPDRNKGQIIVGAVQMPCQNDCADNCTTVDCNTVAEGIIADFNSKKLVGGIPVTQYVQASKITNCGSPAALNFLAYCQWTTTVPDDGSSDALGEVQSQYPGFTVARLSYSGVFSTYGFYDSTCTTPTAFNLNYLNVIPNCTTCPSGFTLTPSGLTFEVKVSGASSATTSAIGTAINGGLSAYTPTTTTLLQLDTLTGVATYNVLTNPSATQALVNTALLAVSFTAPAKYQSTVLVGSNASYCVASGGLNYPWASTPSACQRVQVTYTLGLQDPQPCGGNWLSQLQAAYANITVSNGGTIPSTVTGTVTLIATNAATCSHEYQLVTYSDNCLPSGCVPTDVVFPTIPDFNGGTWTAQPLAEGTSCVCGIEFEAVYVPRKTHEATFDLFAYQTDNVHIEISSYNPDWRSTDLCETDPKSTRVRNFAYPNGAGEAVARLEKLDRMYEFDYFYRMPELREAFDFFFETKFQTYYDQVALEYEFEYASNDGFGQYDHDRYIQYFYLPEDNASNLIIALNTYVSSANINLPLLTL